MKNDNIENLWTHLYWLMILGEQQSYTRAALRLDVSKGAISMKIQQLEKIAGVPLVQRTTRNVRLTPAGENLVAELKQPFSQISQSFSAVHDAHGPVRGIIRITAPVAFARQRLVPHINTFLREYPQVRIQLEVSDRLVSLTREGFDLAIRHSDSIPETHVAQPLCETRTLLVASPGYLHHHGLPSHPNDLAEHDCLYYPRGTDSPKWSFSNTERPHEFWDIAVKGPFATNNSESIRDAALSGLGIAMLPDFSAAEAISTGKLQVVLADWQIRNTFAQWIWLVRPYTPHTPRAVSVFSRWLRSQFTLQE